MEETIHVFLQEHLYLCALVIFVCFIALLMAMVVDLVAGVMKAKELGIARTSTGYKKSCDKAKKYFPTFIEASMLDVATCIVSPFPIFCVLWTVYLCFCEFKSVREKAFEKAEIRRQDRTMQVVLENREDIAKAIAEAMRQAQEKEGGKDGEA